MDVIQLSDRLVCPKCGRVWEHDTFTTELEPPRFQPKCGKCGYVFATELETS